jgi:DNA-binding protein YbaB
LIVVSFEEAVTGDAYARVAELAERAKGLQEALTTAGGTASGPSGLVTVRVGANGELEELTIAPRAMRLDAESLAQEIMAGYEEALAESRERMGALLGELMEDEDLGILMTPGNQDSLNVLTEQALKDAVSKMDEATSRLRRQF